jgi:hypothetical protein
VAGNAPHTVVSRYLLPVALVVASGIAQPGLALALAPALLLLALLAGGIRPGEGLIERLRERRVNPPRPRPAAVLWPRLELVVRPVRWSVPALAVRPPPCVV